MLTEQQRQFCHEYMKDFCIAAAMRRVGYSPTYIDRDGYKLIKKPDVAFYLKGLMDKRNEKHEITAELVIEQMRRLAFADIVDYYEYVAKANTYVLKPFHELTAAQRAPIASYDPKTGYTFYSKDPSLDRLAKYFKLYSDIDTVATGFVLMPELKLNGKKLEFDVGKPAPRRVKKD